MTFPLSSPSRLPDDDRRSSGPSGSDYIDPAEYLQALWDARVVVVAIALICAAVAALVTVLRPRQYQSTVTLAVIQPVLASSGQSLGTANYRPLIESPTLARDVISSLGLAAAPDRMAPSSFLSNLVVDEVRGTNLIRVTVTFREPVMAMRIADLIGEKVTAIAHGLNIREQDRANALIRQQLDQATARLAQAESDLKVYRTEAQVEALKKDIEAQLGDRGNLLQLLVGIESEKAKLARLEEELAARPRVDTMRRTFDADPALAEAVRRGTANVQALQMSAEEINGVYQAIDAQAATARSNLAGMLKRKSELVDVRKLDATVLPQLTRLYEREAGLARRQTERDLADKVYVDLSQRYEVARMEVVGRTVELQVVDPAAQPDQPAPRNLVRNAALAGMGGFGMTCVAVILLHALRLARGSRRAHAAS